MIAVQEIEFYLYDHLGNTRVVYELTYAGGVLELVINYTADYFPYGKVLREYVNTSTGDPEKFLTTQHERDKETGLDYRGARFYDSDIGRFLSLDPHAVDYPGMSPYSYVFNNPVHFVDPDGKDGVPYLEAYLNGLNDAITSNTVQLGFGRDLASEMYPNDLYAQKAFLEGQIVGDFVSLVMGGFTFDAGLMGLGTSGLLAVNVEGAVVTVPAATVLAISSAISIGAGAYIVYNAQQGLRDSYAQLKMVHKKIDAQEAKSSGGSDKSRNKPKEEGVPNSSEIQAKDQGGKTTKYSTYDQNGKLIKEYRGTGKDHGNIPRPNVKEPNKNINPKTGEEFQNGYKVRPAKQNEIPK